MTELLHFILDYEEPFKSKSRLASLYSDFSTLRTTNPDGYHANISAWQSALLHSSRAGVTNGSGVLSLCTGQRLAEDMELRGLGRPLALGDVVEDAIASRTMITMEEFWRAKSSIYEKRWMRISLATPWQVAKWGLRQVGFGGGNRTADGEVVLLANVEAAAKEVIASISKTATTPTSLVYSIETFTHTFSHALSPTHGLTQTDVRILLSYLSRDKHLASISHPPNSSITTIKFSPATSVNPPQITPHDITVATLQALLLSLNTQISTLNTRIHSLTTTARTSISISDRASALNALRTKKLLETTLTKRQDSRAQVEAVLMNIDEAAGQVEMVRAMEASTRVLKDLNKEVGGVERVEVIMEGFREEMEGVEEVARVVGEDGMDAGGLDEEEVDEELEALEKEEEGKRRVVQDGERKRVLERMPDVPGETALGGKHAGGEEVVDEEMELDKRLSLMSLDEPETNDTSKEKKVAAGTPRSQPQVA